MRASSGLTAGARGDALSTQPRGDCLAGRQRRSRGARRPPGLLAEARARRTEEALLELPLERGGMPFGPAGLGRGEEPRGQLVLAFRRSDGGQAADRLVALSVIPVPARHVQLSCE